MKRTKLERLMSLILSRIGAFTSLDLIKTFPIVKVWDIKYLHLKYIVDIAL